MTLLHSAVVLAAAVATQVLLPAQPGERAVLISRSGDAMHADARLAQPQASPRDTARATLGGAKVLVDYGRPSKRGRAIFGGLVPWGQVWRTGANAATQLETSTTLVVGGTTIPAGKYTLYTLPTEKGVQLIVNKQTGQWGTEYHQEQDLARIAMRSSTAAAPVEQFTIALEPAGQGLTLKMSWDTTVWSVPVAKK